MFCMQRFLKFSTVKLVTMSETILLGCPFSENIILHIFLRFSTLNPSILHLAYEWEYAVVIYGTEIMLVMRVKMSVLTDSHGLLCTSCGIVFTSCCVKIQAGSKIFIISSMSAFILIQLIHMPTAMSLQFLYSSDAAIVVPCLLALQV